MLAGLRPSSDFNDHRADSLADALVAALGTLERPHRPADWSSSSARRASSTATGRPTSPSSSAKSRRSSPSRARRRARRWRSRRQGVDEVLAVEVAGPGFVNFKLATSLAAPGAGRGRRPAARRATPRPTSEDGERVQIEFVSANPTGPLHVGNGWLGSYGDALGRVMSRCGWEVSARVLRERHRRPDPPPRREPARPPPRRGRAGGGLSGRVRHPAGGRVRRARGRRRSRAVSPATGSSRTSRATLARLDICFDEWYSQASIEESGQVAETIELLRERGPRLRGGRGDLAAVHRGRRQPRPGARQVERRRHLSRRRPRLPPRQVPRPQVRPGHRRLRRRPPRPGRQPEGRRGGARRRA